MATVDETFPELDQHPSGVAEVEEPPYAGARRCTELVERGGGVICDRYAGHDGEHSWGSGPFTRSTPDRFYREPDHIVPSERETVAKALEAVCLLACPVGSHGRRDRPHDPVCRILRLELESLRRQVASLEAMLEAGSKREPVAPAGTTDGDRDGVTFTPEFDRDRLNRQALDVYDTLAGNYGAPGGQWWTLRELADFTGHPEASISARIRDLRKPRYGALTIDRRRRGEGRGTWEYRLEPPA